ncbi:MAG: AAA family ATPase [Bryobacteraceae bacterium]
MSMPQAATRPPRSGPPPAAKTDFASLISSKGQSLPNRYVLYAGEGWGKTSFAAMMPKPIFMQTRGETGLETLIDAGQLGETPHFPEIMDWRTMVDGVHYLRDSTHDYRTLVIDTLNGAERLLHEMVCARDYQNDWGDRGFGAYQKGYDVSIADLNLLLSDLDAKRLEKRMIVVWLAHRRVITFKNPSGADYDLYQPDVHKTTWGAVSKWSDVILFGDMEVIVETEKKTSKKGKGVAQNRLIRCESAPSWVAKNRLGLPPEIEAGQSPQEAWANFAAAVKAAKQKEAVA